MSDFSSTKGLQGTHRTRRDTDQSSRRGWGIKFEPFVKKLQELRIIMDACRVVMRTILTSEETFHPDPPFLPMMLLSNEMTVRTI